MKEIGIFGVGKLGLCFALNLERKGYYVVGSDINREYVDALNAKTFISQEKGVSEMLTASTSFRATTSFDEVLMREEIFVMVATPSLPDGKYDHSQVDRIVDDLVKRGKQVNKKYLTICCTTMPGYCDTVQQRLKPLNYVVSYNPEFIAQGTIVANQRNPDMILIGEGNVQAGDRLEALYRDMVDNMPVYSRMSRTEAEVTKIALNCYLTTKIAFANMVGDLANNMGLSHSRILSAIGSDSRIGNKYLAWGYGFGGPCFPRDNRAFGIALREHGVYPYIPNSTDMSNSSHLEQQVKHIEKFNPRQEDGSYLFESVTYKPESTMIEESQQLQVALKLVEKGERVVIREREEVIKQVKALYGEKFIYEQRGV